MQLLKITNIPAQLTIDVEKARLVSNNQPRITSEITQTPGEIRIQSENTKVRIDTTEMRASMNLTNPDRVATENAAKGENAAKQATAKYARQGFEMTQLQKGTDIKDILAATFFPDPTPTLVTKFIPSQGPELSWSPAQLEMNYRPADVKVSWKDVKQSMEYIPGRISMQVTQHPRVDIEYVGAPNYFPESADPQYKG